MAFADAIFDGKATLEGVEVIRVDDPADLPGILRDGTVVPIVGDDRSRAQLVAGETTDVVVETSWEQLGHVFTCAGRRAVAS